MSLVRLRRSVARLAARFSRDRSTLDLLLEVGDLSPGWFQRREMRYRVGFARNEDRDRRARQLKLIGALRLFSQPDALSHVVTMVSPAATDEDAHARLADGQGIQWDWASLVPAVTDKTEVTPPPEAGEHARAFLSTIASSQGESWRQLQVIWVEPGQPIVAAIAFRGPSVLEVWDFVSLLVHRQRQRLGGAHFHVPVEGIGQIGQAPSSTIRAKIRRSTRAYPKLSTAVMVMVLVAAALYLSVPGSTAPGSTAQAFGSFAGYQDPDAVVSQVSATLTVPQISPSSSYSYASTWVGAEVVGQGSNLPLIEAGVHEREEADAPPSDQAYWTDTARDFNSVPLFSVRPGDRVSVNLTHSHRHWTITVIDGRTRRRIVTAQDGGDTFGDAEWLQENPDPGSGWVYPQMTDIHLSNLSVNGAHPAQSALDTNLMAVDHGKRQFKPTALAGDAFTVEPIGDSAAAQQRTVNAAAAPMSVQNAPQRCKQQAPRGGSIPSPTLLGSPIIYRRGSYIAVLFVDYAADNTLFCSYEPTPYGPSNQFTDVAENQPAVPSTAPSSSLDNFEGIESAPAPVGIQDSQGGDSVCDSPPNPNLGEMYGFAGKDVAGATFLFAHDPPIKAVVERGFYIASWPYASWPDAVALRTTSGTTVTRHVPPRGCAIQPGSGTPATRRLNDVASRGTVVVVVVRTRDGSAKSATTFTTRGAAEISPRGVEQTSVDTASFMDRGFQAMSSGNSEGIYDPTNNTVYETTQNAELGASLAGLMKAGTKLRQRLKSSHPSAQASQRTTTINVKPSSKLGRSLEGMTEPGLNGLSDMFVPHVGRRERVVARVTIDGHPALKLAQAWYMTDLGGMGEVGGYGTMYVTPKTYEPIRDVLPNGNDTVTNTWLSYRVLPATRANLKLVSLTALHPGARVSHSATGFLQAQDAATNQ